MKKPGLLILLTLAVVTLAAYWRVGACGFVGYDDPAYVRDNAMINQGLRAAAVCWAFTAPHASNWHPLTSLSHMLDCSLFDLNPGPMHAENLLLHLGNAWLVFLVWRRLSGAAWPSALVAAFFALHPLRVESVAWISERKDVLSTMLWLLTLLAYARWIERPSRLRYAAVAGGLALGLMAKPMVVTLPATLLLLDYWPLRRWPARGWAALVWEKIPLFALAAAGSAATLWAQHATGAVEYGARFSAAERLANALVSYARYLGKTFWPHELAPFYPHPGAWPWSVVLGAAVLVLGGSALAWRERARRPWLLFGWCWYLGTLVPAIGLLQVGAQSLADRYTYVPLLGIFTALAWSGAELVRRWPRTRGPAIALAALALGACAVRTAAQVAVWQTPATLAAHLYAVVGEHDFVRRLRARALLVAGRPEAEAMALYREGLTTAPESPYFPHELAVRAAKQGRYAEARTLVAQAQALRPQHAAPLATLGSIAELEGQLAEAEQHYRRSLALDPRAARVHRLLAMNLLKQGRHAEALEAGLAATRCDRWDTVAWNQLGMIYADLARYAESLACLERALWIHPRDPAVASNVDAVRKRMRDGK